MSKKLLAAIAALLAVLAGGTFVLTDDDPPALPATVTVPVDGPDADTTRDDTITLNPAEQDLLDEANAAPEKATAAGDLEAGTLREPSDGPPVLNEGPLAAQEIPGCRTRFVINSSSRNGTPVRIIVWHQTVSRDRGQASQDALTAYANTRSSGVSWHALIGGTSGLCTYSVPLNLKAWTQGNANRFAVGIEVERYGDEPRYTTGPGTAKLLFVTRHIGRRFEIPMRRGLVTNCRPVRSGIVEHSDLGACGGGHADVTPWSTDYLIRELASGGVTGTDKVTCRKLNAWRNAGSPKGGAWERNSVRRRRALDKRHVTCTARGPVKA